MLSLRNCCFQRFCVPLLLLGQDLQVLRPLLRERFLELNCLRVQYLLHRRQCLRLQLLLALLQLSFVLGLQLGEVLLALCPIVLQLLLHLTGGRLACLQLLRRLSASRTVGLAMRRAEFVASGTVGLAMRRAEFVASGTVWHRNETGGMNGLG